MHGMAETKALASRRAEIRVHGITSRQKADGDEPVAANAGPHEAVTFRHRDRGIGKCAQPLARRSSESCGEHPGKFPDCCAVPGGCTKYEQAPDTRAIGCVSPNSGHFVGQISELGTTVRHEIDDLNDGKLRPAEAGQMDIDRSGSICARIDCQLGLRGPAASAC
jgi:hypothetical protein